MQPGEPVELENVMDPVEMGPVPVVMEPVNRNQLQRHLLSR